MVVNAAVVGYGYSGRAFHSYLIGLAGGIRLHAISTRDPGRQAQAREQHPEATIYRTIDELLADRQVDLVIIATPHNTHRDLAVKAMEAGRHVVVDKIMCMNAREAEEMIAASQRHGVMLSVFHNRRWDWDYLTVRKVIDDGLLGRPYLFQAAIMRYRPPGRWRADKEASGGILFDWPAHLVDQALRLVPAPVASVYCQTVTTNHWDIGIENYAKLILRFQNDAIYEIEVSNLAAAHKPRWYVAGDLGALVKYGLDPQETAMNRGDIDAAEEDPTERAQVTTWIHNDQETIVMDSVRGSWRSYYQNISEVLNEGAELIVRPEEVYLAMRVYDAAMESASSGLAITMS